MFTVNCKLRCNLWVLYSRSWQLLAALSTPGEQSCGAVAEALAAIGADPKRAVPALLESLPNGNSYSQKRTAQAILELGVLPEQLPQLFESLEGRSSEVRSLLLTAVDRMGASALSAVPELLKAFDGSSADVREVAARSLG